MVQCVCVCCFAGEYNLRLGIMKELAPDMVSTYQGESILAVCASKIVQISNCQAHVRAVEDLAAQLLDGGSRQAHRCSSPAWRT